MSVLIVSIQMGLLDGFILECTMKNLMNVLPGSPLSGGDPFDVAVHLRMIALMGDVW